MFPLPQGTWDVLRYFIMALPEPIILLFGNQEISKSCFSKELKDNGEKNTW